MPVKKHRHELPDVQERTSGFPKKYIKKVGIRQVKVPLKVQRKDGTINICSADISMYSSLKKEEKGTNMSRYRILIEEYLINKDLVLHDFIHELLQATRIKLKQDNAYVKIQFPYYFIQKSPVSDISSYMDINVAFEGELVSDKVELTLTVRVPYTSCCPCSKEISLHGAHNQRSFAEVKVTLNEKNGILWIEDIYDLVTKLASAPIINGLKREDEKWQTELMFEQPRFVEDMVRLIGEQLDKELDKRITDYVIVCNHEESIHTHDATAILTAGRILK